MDCHSLHGSEKQVLFMGVTAMKKQRMAVVVAVAIIFLLLAGCAMHGEFSSGAGKGVPYAASMSGGRGVGMDWPEDFQSVSNKKKSEMTRAARD